MYGETPIWSAVILWCSSGRGGSSSCCVHNGSWLPPGLGSCRQVSFAHGSIIYDMKTTKIYGYITYIYDMKTKKIKYIYIKHSCIRIHSDSDTDNTHTHMRAHMHSCTQVCTHMCKAKRYLHQFVTVALVDGKNMSVSKLISVRMAKKQTYHHKIYIQHKHGWNKWMWASFIFVFENKKSQDSLHEVTTNIHLHRFFSLKMYQTMWQHTNVQNKPKLLTLYNNCV